jgi:4-hydroxy-tetrahydrodipicolinate synthase
MLKELKGTGIALVTPFTKDGTVDFISLEKVINHTIKGKVEYLVSLGTTGETATMSKEEQKEVLNFTIDIVKKRVPIVAGFGGNNTANLVESIKGADLKNVTAILSASPYYNKPTQEGIYQHYKAVANATKKPIILYNVPGRTASNITAETTLRLAKDFKNIVAIKEASGDFMQCMHLAKYRPKDFLLISGDDAFTLPLLSVGFDGVISVVGNALPKQFSDMVRAGLAGDYAKAQKLHNSLLDIIKNLFVEGNPAGVKAALKILGVTATDSVRLPLVSASENLHKTLKTQISGLK